MVRPRSRPAEAASPPGSGDGLDVNAVVSYNVKAIRERRGMTQQAVADRLAELTGHQLPQASISAMERGFDGERRRRFDAHELYLLSQVFDVPIAYFFIPPAGMTGHGAGRHPPAGRRAVPVAARHRGAARGRRRAPRRHQDREPRGHRRGAHRRVRP